MEICKNILIIGFTICCIAIACLFVALIVALIKGILNDASLKKEEQKNVGSRDNSRLKNLRQCGNIGTNPRPLKSPQNRLVKNNGKSISQLANELNTEEPKEMRKNKNKEEL